MKQMYMEDTASLEQGVVHNIVSAHNYTTHEEAHPIPLKVASYNDNNNRSN